MKELLENLQGFIQTNIDIAKLEVQEKIETTIKSASKYLIIIFLGFFSILFILLGLAHFLGNILGETYFGFGIVAIILIITSAIIYFSMHRKTNNS